MKKHDLTLMVTSVFATTASVSGGVWAATGNPIVFASLILLVFATLYGLLQWYVDVSITRTSRVAAQLLLQDAIKADKLVGADARVAKKLAVGDAEKADLLVTQDQVTADTLAEADENITRNVKQTDNST